MAEWWKKAFINNIYPLGELSRTPGWKQKTRSQIRFISRLFKKHNARSVLDICCGTGRHAIGLAREGFQVTGFDLSKAYLRQALQGAKKSKASLALAQGDARAMPYRERFDAAVNLFTSFGYFERSSDDLRLLRSAQRSLKKDGLFLIDTFNGQVMLKNQAFERKTRFGRLQIEEKGRYLAPQKIAETRWIFIKGGKREEMISRIRMYTKPALSKLLKRAGFKVLKAFGDLDGRPYGARSPRLVLLARRP